MTNGERIGLAITAVEFVGSLLVAKMFKKAIDKKVQKQYNCRDAKDYIRKVESGEIRLPKIAP